MIELKSYNTGSSTYGLVDGKYMKFPSEQEYEEYLQEKETEEDSKEN
jgi:hypothetical protein